jgi:hypothetical protein
MIFLFAVAVVVAIAQHIVYSYLNNREVDQVVITQTWVIQVGNAMGFLFKSVLVAAVGIAFCHRFWYSVRRETIRIGSLDSMFTVLQDPWQFLNIDLIFKTQVLFILAGIAWLVPISAIFAPGALTGSFLLVF